jgi:translation initiation factor 3 subunit I
LWDLKTGTEICHFTHNSTVRSVAFAHGDKMILTVQGGDYGAIPTIFIFNLDEKDSGQRDDPIRTIPVDEKDAKRNKVTIRCAEWGALNRTVLGACSDGTLRVWDVQKSKEIFRSSPDDSHKQRINDLQLNKERTQAITVSDDYTAKLWDIRDQKLVLKRVFRSDHPLNAGAIHPLYNQVVVGGGQDAMNVTTTAAGAGHFESEFFHSVYSERIGAVGGHFGTMNTLAISPLGDMYATASIDGFVRLHHFSDAYKKNSKKYDWEGNKKAALPST